MTCRHRQLPGRCRECELEAQIGQLHDRNAELLAALAAIVEEAGPRMGLDDTPGSINTMSRIARGAIAKAPLTQPAATGA